MQLREGTGEEVFFILEKSPHFTAIFPTGRTNFSDSVDKLMINHWTIIIIIIIINYSE